MSTDERQQNLGPQARRPVKGWRRFIRENWYRDLAIAAAFFFFWQGYGAIQDSRREATRNGCIRDNNQSAALRSLFVNFLNADVREDPEVMAYLARHEGLFVLSDRFVPPRRPGTPKTEPKTAIAFLEYVRKTFPRVDCEARVKQVVR